MGFEEDRQSLLVSLRQKIGDNRVLDAMSHIPRELFVPLELASNAYVDAPLPIGLGQTISQPFIVAMMSEALQLNGQEKVLEIGTGSGYQTAILSLLAREIISVERIPALLEKARSTLDQLGYKNISLVKAGQQLGYPPGAPYDAILVTAAAPQLPTSLLTQLKDGGRLVIPVGDRIEQIGRAHV